MVYQDKKISGSAFKHDPYRKVSLHHGTVLVNTDMKALQRYLTPDKRKLLAKGIASVGARVINLNEEFPDLHHEALCGALVDEFRERTGADGPVEQVEDGWDFTTDPVFKGYRAELEDKAWRLGETPNFSHQLETRIDGVGVFDVQMEVVHGKVEKCVIFSDALYPGVIDEAMKALVGISYGREGVAKALGGLKASFPEDGPRKCLEALMAWLDSNLDD